MRCTPSRQDVLAHQGDEHFAAISVSLIADTETPISVFQKLAGDRPRAFLLESVEGGEVMGRYSFMGCDVSERFEFADGRGVIVRGEEREEIAVTDPMVTLRGLLAGRTVWAPQALPRFMGGAVGYLGFDCVRYFEGSPLPERKSVDVPEGVLLMTDEVAIYDHLQHRLTLVVHMPLSGDRSAAYAEAVARLAARVEALRTAPSLSNPWLLEGQRDAAGEADIGELRVNRTQENMEAAVSQAREAIAAGEVFQVVVSQRLSVPVSLNPLALYRSLRTVNPSPYMFYLHFEDFAVVGASPEVLVRLEDGELLVRPIAGTRRRGRDRDEDLALEAELLADEKELAEHRMLVDLGRNDLGRVAAVGSVRVSRPLHIERYSHVMHIVTDLYARLAPGIDAFDVFRACFPAGTVSGAPKIRACELLAHLEPDRRGLYAGAVGYFGVDGNMDTCIAIRTMLVEPDAVHIQAGAGLVYDSVPAHEHQECLNKARAGLEAIKQTLARGGAR